ncbi:MAG: hypothetical protein ACI4VQ_08000 [Clostridia bacterium]
MMNFNEGDMVTPKKQYAGNGHIFIIINKNSEKRNYNLQLFYKNFKIHGYIPDESITWNENELALIRTIESIDYENKVNPFQSAKEIAKKTALEFINGQVPLYIYHERNFNNKLTDNNVFIKQIKPKIDINKKEEINMEKILEIYGKREKMKIIDNYNIAMKKAKEDDEIQKICIDFEKKIRELVGSQADAYCFNYTLYTDETKLSFESIEKNKDIELDNLHKKVEEIEALLNLAPDYDDKIKILRDYDIIDKKKNIML